MKVLISNPCLHPNSVWPPYLWARFKTFIDLDYEHDLNVTWIDPLYEHDPVLPDCDFDILVLSCYVWNYEKQIKLAEQVKLTKPNVFVIAGGPQVPYNDDSMWDTYKHIDAVCYTEGEKVFADFLYAWQHDKDIDIPGILLRTNKYKPKTTVPKIDLSALHSPYLHCKEELQRYSKQIKDAGYRLNLIWETNRGCPYSCTFCDWGMATNSKVKRFNKDMLMKEIQTFMAWNPDMVFIADANWGMYNDDVDFVEELVKQRYKYDYVTTVAFSAAKNKKTIVNKTLELLHNAGMNGGANQLGFQHLDEEVLKIIKRDNIKTTKSLEELTETYNSGIDVIGVLILGNPGDTVDKWKHSLFQLLYMQFHDDIKVHDFMLLPNAPAADPKYMEQYKLGYVEKYYNEKPNGKNNQRTLYKTKFICESFSFTKDDWIEMQVWSYFLQACHTLGLFRYMSMFAYHAMGISYENFYEKLFKIDIVQDIINIVRTELRHYVYGDKQDKFMQYTDHDIDIEMSIDNYLYMKMIDQITEIYDKFDIDLGNYSYSIEKLQKQISYNYYQKKDFELDYDYKTWFEQALKLEPFKTLDVLPEKIKTQYKFEDHKKLKPRKIVNKLDVAPNYRHQIVLHGELLWK